MNPAQLLSHFDRIGEAPDAIPRLRRFILDLAVRGKLVEQDLRDEPAAELLKRIQSEKERLVKAGKIKKLEILPPIEPEEVPFEVPRHWNLVRIGESLKLINGRAFKPNEWGKGGLPIIRIQNLNNTAAPFNHCEAPIPEKFRVKTGDFLISWSGTPGTSFGAHIWDRGSALLNQHIFKAELIGKAFLPHFLKLAINSRLLELIDQAQGGVGLQHITKPKLEMLPLTLPPLAEQHRIVAKVDELMALCDRLEAAQAERESRRNRLVGSSLHHLNNGADADAFQEHARFYFNHLPRFTTRPDHIKQLRQTILNLAVRGKLATQDPTDEPVPNLLTKLTRLKAQLLAERKIRKQKVSNSPSINEFPFDIPDEWKWIRLGQAVTLLGGYAYESGAYVPKSSNQIIRLGNVKNDTLLLDQKPVFIPDTLAQQTIEYAILEGDILITMTGTKAKRDYAFTLAVKTTDLEKRHLFLNQRVGAIRPFQPELVPLINLFLKSDQLLNLIFATGTGTANQANIGTSSILDLPFPLPPLAEQHRIVAKVDALMALCDQLETQLTTTQSESRHLLEAVLHQTIEG